MRLHCPQPDKLPLKCLTLCIGSRISCCASRTFACRVALNDRTHTEAMATLARAKGVRTMIGLQAHGDPVLLRLRELLPSPPLLEHYPEDDLLLEIDTDARHRHWLVRQSVRLWTACLTWSSPHLEHYPTVKEDWWLNMNTTRRMSLILK